MQVCLPKTVAAIACCFVTARKWRNTISFVFDMLLIIEWSGQHWGSHPDRVGVLSNAAVVLSNRLTSCIDLLGVDTILGVQVLHFSVGEDPAGMLI